MRAQALIVVSAVVTAILSAGAATVSADTLFTGADHTARVGVGATASIAAGTVTALASGTLANVCTASTLNLRLEQNDATAVAGTLTSGTFTGCSTAAAGDFPWRFIVRGSGVISGTSRVYTNATWDDVSATLWGVDPGNGTLTDASGSPPTDGVYVRQSATSGASICFVLNDAGTLTGPLLTDGAIDATYCLEGATATAWSLGTTAYKTPVTLYTTPARTASVPLGATASLVNTTTLGFTSGTATVDRCQTSTLNVSLRQNGSPGVQFTVTDGSFGSCINPHLATFPWTITITAHRQVHGTTVAYPTTTLANYRYDFLGGLYSGTLPPATNVTATGLYASQSTGATAPVCLNMNHAGPVTGPLWSLNLDGQYCFEGGAASTWSLT